MAESRTLLLEQIADQFEQQYDALRKGLDSRPGDSWLGIAERVEELDRLHALTARFPVWPFDPVSVRRFVFTVAAPVTPVVVQLLQNVGNRIWPGTAP